MLVNFKRDKVTYQLLVGPSGRRDKESVEVKPDPSLWTSAQKRKSGLFTKLRDDKAA